MDLMLLPQKIGLGNGIILHPFLQNFRKSMVVMSVYFPILIIIVAKAWPYWPSHLLAQADNSEQ